MNYRLECRKLRRLFPGHNYGLECLKLAYIFPGDKIGRATAAGFAKSQGCMAKLAIECLRLVWPTDKAATTVTRIQLYFDV